jgi:hypothetical protein
MRSKPKAPVFVLQSSNEAMTETKIGDFEDTIMLIVGILNRCGTCSPARLVERSNEESLK